MYRRIAVGFDGSQGSRRALEVAVNLARSAKAELFLVSIEELPRYPAAIDEVDDEQRSAEESFAWALERVPWLTDAIKASAIVARGFMADAAP